MGRKELLERALIAAGFSVQSNICHWVNVVGERNAVEIEVSGTQFNVYSLANDAQTLCSSVSAAVDAVREYCGRK